MTQESKDTLLIQMEAHLDALIANASKMNQLAEQGLTEDELTRLQNEQCDLLEKLSASDKWPNENADPKNSAIADRIEQKLEQFEKLNDEFIEKLNKGHGIIQFDHKHTPKEKD